jgi:hypothetical protein
VASGEWRVASGKAKSFGSAAGKRHSGEWRSQGRKCGKAEVVFLLRLENVFWFICMGLQRFLNMGLLRLDFSSPLK